jgi:hypothetical protein
MKITFALLFILVAGTAFGQTAGMLSYQSVTINVPSHPLHAGPHDMATETPLVGQGPNAYSYGHGERPLWEFGPVTEEPSLGDVARAYRKQKLTAKKAEIVFEKQGS